MSPCCVLSYPTEFPVFFETVHALHHVSQQLALPTGPVLIARPAIEGANRIVTIIERAASPEDSPGFEWIPEEKS